LTILYTYRLIKAQNGEVILLKKKMEDEASYEFSNLEKEVLQGQGISYDFRTEVGFVSDRIEDHIRKNTISFLVMNKGMSSGSKEIFDDLVKDMNVPLVIVP
jgi:hypothetical protein